MSWGLYLLYVALTFLRPFESFLPELESYRPMLVMLALCSATSLTAWVMDRRSSIDGRLPALIAAFMACIGLSLLTNREFTSAGLALIEFTPTAMLFVLTLINVNSLQRLRVACGVVVASTFLLALASTVAFHTGYMAEHFVLRQNAELVDGMARADLGEFVVPAKEDSGTYLWRAMSVGFLSDPNDFAQALIMALPLLFVRVREDGRPFASPLRLAAATVIVYAIVLTSSRGAVVGFGAMLLYAVARRYGLRGLAIAAALGAIAATVIDASGGRSFSSSEESAGDRIDAWWAGLQMFAYRPVFGIGYGNFIDHHHLTAHNSFVLAFAELGLVGHFVWLSLLALPILECRRIASSGLGPLSRQAEAILVAFVAWLACSVFLSRTYAPNLYLLLALAAAAAQCARRAEPSTARAGAAAVRRTSTRWVRVSAVGALATVAGMWAVLRIEALLAA